MPVTRIAIRDGKTSEYKQALLDEIYEAMPITPPRDGGGGGRQSAAVMHGFDVMPVGIEHERPVIVR